MSVVTKEEIKRIVIEHAHTDRVTLAERVAALVEQRLREMVCDQCGDIPTVECSQPNPHRITRAQYESERDGR